MYKIALLLLFLLVSCAPKVCPKPKEVLKDVFKKPPEKVKLYGYVKAPFMRIPFIFEKNNFEEIVKTPNDLVILSTSNLCLRGMCFDLPVRPVDFIYGYFPGKYEVKDCNGEILLSSPDGKEIIVEGNKLKAFKYKDIKVIYGERSPEGYYREITIKFGDQNLKIFIRGLI